MPSRSPLHRGNRILPNMMLSTSVSCEGAAVVNACGVPGSIGCFALTLHESQPVLLTTHHVLFGAGAPEHAPVSLAHRTGGRPMLEPIGRAGWGKRGLVRFGDSDVFVDCAVVRLDARVVESQKWRAQEQNATTQAVPGACVTKSGAATGRTAGVVVDVEHTATIDIDGRRCEAPQQIVVRSQVRGHTFSAAGDSGAALRDECGAIVGLLWGLTAGGDAIACPIAPVLWLLHVQPVRLSPAAASSLNPGCADASAR